MIDPLKQTPIGKVVFGDELVGDLQRVQDYASDFLRMVPNSCHREDFHEVCCYNPFSLSGSRAGYTSEVA